MISLLINILVLVIVVGLIWWLITQLPLPEPFGRFAQIAIVVIACIALIYLLLGIADSPGLLRLR